MSAELGHLSLSDAAKQTAGNWQHFNSFSWHRRHKLDTPEQWCIVYTHNRDSGLLDQSNADAINDIMGPFFDADEPDVISEHHDHWGCGWVDGLAIRVYRAGEITPAFTTYHGILERLADYPVLDEEKYSAMEYEATCANIEQAYRGLREEYELPEGWASEVFSWFWNHNQRAVENRDDQGGYPSNDELRAAFTALGYPCLDNDKQA